MYNNFYIYYNYLNNWISPTTSKIAVAGIYKVTITGSIINTSGRTITLGIPQTNLFSVNLVTDNLSQNIMTTVVNPSLTAGYYYGQDILNNTSMPLNLLNAYVTMDYGSQVGVLKFNGYNTFSTGDTCIYNNIKLTYALLYAL